MNRGLSGPLNDFPSMSWYQRLISDSSIRFPFIPDLILSESSLLIRPSRSLNANCGGQDNASQQSTCMPSLRTSYAGSGQHQANWQCPWSLSVYMCSLRLK